MNSFPRNIQWKNYKINIILIHDKDATISRVCSVTFASRLTCSPLRAPWTTKPLCGTFYQLYAQEQCLVHPHRWRSDQKVNTEGLLISQFWYRSFCLCQHWLYTMNSSFWDKIIIITLMCESLFDIVSMKLYCLSFIYWNTFLDLWSYI